MVVDRVLTVGDRLLELLHVDPHEAETAARSALEAAPGDELEVAKLRWVIGLALRSAGRLVDARAQLELAQTSARQVGHLDVAARISSSLAFLVGQQGDLDHAASLLRDAEPHLSGAELAKATGQLGTILYWRGDLAEAARRLSSSCEELTMLGDHVFATRYRGNLGAVLSLLGDYDGAERELRAAVASAEAHSLDHEAGLAAANLGYVANLRGDLPNALVAFSRAESHYQRANAQILLPQLHADHAQALADAGLFDDADGLVRASIDTFMQQGQHTELAGALLTSAEIRLAQADLAGAIEAADDARERFTAQGRPSWTALARSLALQAKARQHPRPVDLDELPDVTGIDHLDGSAGSDAAGPLDLDDLDELDLATQLVNSAADLARHGWVAEATRCRLVAAKLVAGGSSSADAVDPVDPALRTSVERGRASDRILLADVDAISAISAGDRRRARRAVTRGLEVAMSSQAALGSIETRAHAAVHGYALTELGARLAIEDRRPRELLERIEATRLMTSRMPDVRPPDDPEMAAMLTTLRALNSRIADASTTEEQRREAEVERARAEGDVRRRSRTVSGDATSAVRLRAELDAALRLLGERHLLAHAALDGRLYAVSVVEGRAGLHDLGSLEGISERIEGVVFSLNRLNRRQGSEASRVAAAEMLYAMAEELAEQLVPPVIADSMSAVIIVPTAVLHDVPWGLLPTFGGRAVSVNPSLTAWARAEHTRQERAAARSGAARVGFMAGPGLELAEFEVENLAALYRHPEVFTGPEANGDACVGLLGRADLVHIACHGSFRTDNPMFSSLHLADGPLIVHDLERLERLPETVVLPACSVANTKVVRGGALLGLATALITLGAANVIAPLTPISDESSVVAMHRLHRELVAGATPAAALAVAALAHDLADPTAAAFIALGA